MAKAHPSGRFLVAGEAQPLWNPRQVVVVRRAKEDPPGKDDQTSRSPHIFHQFVSVFKESLGPRKVHCDIRMNVTRAPLLFGQLYINQ